MENPDKIYFSYIKNANKILSKKIKKTFQKRLMKGAKIFLEKNKTKCTNIFMGGIEKEKKHQYGHERYKNILQDEKKVSWVYKKLIYNAKIEGFFEFCFCLP